jgi:hypothetical protein
MTIIRDFRDHAAVGPDGLVPDGCGIRVPMQFRDAAIRERDAGRPNDARGIVHTGGGHSPGYIYSTDATMRDAAEEARAEAIREMCDAWRRPSKEAKPSQSGGDGHCDPEIDDVRRPVLDAAEAERIRAEARDAYIAYVTNAWRR